MKGYSAKPPRIELEPNLAHPGPEDLVGGSILDVATHLYKVLRGTNNLVFPNSRQRVETFTDLLRRMCERDCIRTSSGRTTVAFRKNIEKKRNKR